MSKRIKAPGLKIKAPKLTVGKLAVPRFAADELRLRLGVPDNQPVKQKVRRAKQS